MKRNIPTYDLYVEGQDDAVLHGVHKAHVNAIIADLKANGTSYTLIESKAAKSSKFSKRRKDRKR